MSNPSYIHGKSAEPYDLEFVRIRASGEIRRRDGYTCQKCGIPEIEEINNIRLPLHHIDENKDT
ncbi:unnamed protein product, partial [marine sediment metagenome]